MIIQQKCPICEGNGIVSGVFYDILITETCKNCAGTGVVYVEQELAP